MTYWWTQIKPPRADRTSEKFWDNHRFPLNPCSVFPRNGKMNWKVPGVYTFMSFDRGTRKIFFILFFLLALTATTMVVMVTPVLTSSFAAFWIFFQFLNISHENLDVGRSRQKLHEKPLKNENRDTLYTPAFDTDRDFWPEPCIFKEKRLAY